VRREEAEAQARRQQAEHPERSSYRWFAREADGDDGWVVVRVALPPGTRIDPLTTEIRADEKPPTPDDPRTQFQRDGGNWWAGGG
jgi:hypothetical protein